MVKGLIDEQIYTFISYYSPNTGQDKFFQNMFKILGPLVEGMVIYGGDTNVAFDEGLDKNKLRGDHLIRPSKKGLKIAKMIYSQGLIDIWREINPTMRDYTHYSVPHNLFARINQIFILAKHSPLVTTSSNIHWARIAMDTGDSMILSGPINKAEIEKAIKEYFVLNDTGDVSPTNLWAAHKATIRGKIIQMSVQINRVRCLEVDKLEKEFLSLCKKHKQNPVMFPISKIDSARTTLNMALTSKVEKHLRWAGARFYFHKEKPNSMLATQLSPITHSHHLPKIKIAGGTLSQNPQRILGAFQEFFQKLYSTLEINTPLTLTNFWMQLISLN